MKLKFWKHFFRENDNSPPSGRVKVAAYIKTGTIRRAEAAHAVRLTHRAITGVRYFGADIGWHTAMYRSAESTVKKMELVNCEKRKEKKKYQITSFSIFVRLVRNWNTKRRRDWDWLYDLFSARIFIENVKVSTSLRFSVKFFFT